MADGNQIPSEVDAPVGSPCRASHTKRIQDIVHWIAREANQPLPLAGLARRAGMSPYHFLREFKRVVGISPHRFVLAQRLRRAARRLRHSEDRVLELIPSAFRARGRGPSPRSA
jgi:transcriptional regulator GlxA family with amidase domain